MPTKMLHDDDSRKALGRGVAKLAKAVRGTLGPRGMNVIIDRPIGAPMISRDGVFIVQEIELQDPFENLGARVLREAAMKTNEVVGDGTTTATVLADAMVQHGLIALSKGANAVELVAGMERAAKHVFDILCASARPVKSDFELLAVASIASNDLETGKLVVEALQRVGASGIINVEYGNTVETLLEVVDGMAFDRGYLSHHMVTEENSMQAILNDPRILLTDLKLLTQTELASIRAVVASEGRPLLIVAEEVGPECIVSLLDNSQNGGANIVAINPPDYGHWRRSTLDDIAIVTGGRVIARDLGGRIDQVSPQDLGTAKQVRISSHQTVISAGGGDPKSIEARREQVRRQLELAPKNIERDKLQERLARLSGGVARIHVGGATQVEQRRRAQLIEDAVNAARAASVDGVVAGGGVALLQTVHSLDELIAGFADDQRAGASVIRAALEYPLMIITTNAGSDAAEIVEHVKHADLGIGFDARSRNFCNMFDAGVLDPVAVPVNALRNAVSVASLILTTNTLVSKISDNPDPTAGPALGGGAETLGLA